MPTACFPEGPSPPFTFCSFLEKEAEIGGRERERERDVCVCVCVCACVCVIFVSFFFFTLGTHLRISKFCVDLCKKKKSDRTRCLAVSILEYNLGPKITGSEVQC